MSTRHVPVVYLAAVGAPTAAPTLLSHGIPYQGKNTAAESFLMVSGNGTTAGDTITIRPWWWDPMAAAGAGAWCRGATTTITDDGVIEAYNVGARIYWQVTAMTLAAAGTFELTNQFYDKGA